MTKPTASVCKFCQQSKATHLFTKRSLQWCKACNALRCAIKRALAKCPKLVTILIDKPTDALQCLTCFRVKHRDAFPPSTYQRSGKYRYCLVCLEELTEKQGSKICTCCGLDKKLEAFYPRVDGRYGRDSHCADCRKGVRNQYYADNQEQEAAKAYAHLTEHREQINQRNRDRRLLESEEERTIRLAKDNADYQKNRVKRIAQSIANQKAHPETTRSIRKRRRARMRGATLSDLTHQQWLEIQAAQDHRCAYCGKRCKGKLTQDHIIPVIEGGPHTLHNVIAACQSCNSKKGRKKPLKAVQPLLLTIAASKPRTEKAS